MCSPWLRLLIVASAGVAVQSFGVRAPRTAFAAPPARSLGPSLRSPWQRWSASCPRELPYGNAAHGSSFEKSQSEARDLFKRLDADQNGQLDKSELLRGFPQLDDADADNLIAQADANGDGRLSFEELWNVVQYESINGVKYDRTVLDIARAAAVRADGPRICEAEVEHVIAAILDGRPITEVELRTAFLLLRDFDFTDESRQLFIDRLASS